MATDRVEDAVVVEQSLAAESVISLSTALVNGSLGKRIVVFGT